MGGQSALHAEEDEDGKDKKDEKDEQVSPRSRRTRVPQVFAADPYLDSCLWLRLGTVPCLSCSMRLKAVIEEGGEDYEQV